MWQNLTQMNLSRNSVVKIVIILVLTLIVIFARQSITAVDLALFSRMSLILPAKTHPENPVLITINASDIEALGGFPLKRSYYALLIKRLTKYRVRSIGIEILFSRVDTETDYYDQILQKEISAAGNVFLALPPDYLTDKAQNGGNLNPGFSGAASGHLNYAEAETPVIPSRLYISGKIFPAFSVTATGNQFAETDVRVNFTHPFSSFTQFSLIDFFRIDTNTPDSLLFLKDKIILIGVTDEKYSQKINSHLEGVIPGLGLHAFAVENILDQSGWNNSYYYLLFAASVILFLLPGIYQHKLPVYKRHLLYPALFIPLFITGIIVMLNHIAFPLIMAICLPVLFVVLDTVSSLALWKSSFEASLSETESLKILLQKKTIELQQLEKTISTVQKDSPLPDESLLHKMKEEIQKLRSSIRDEEVLPEEEAGKDFFEFEGMIYRSQPMKQAVHLIKKFAPSDETVLIIGESGTGKELTASALHKNSLRKDKPFVAVNCVALSESLLESELFGHVKGAFTGAIADKEGRFESADGGTIFLDEIGEISENFQLKLLRVLQEGSFEKVGSSKTITVDTRVIAATNKNLEKLAKEGKFREDLYYRINILNISLPPLRERKEDIPYLIQNFITHSAPELKISVAAIEALSAHEWRGNIRELESVIKRAVVFAKGEAKSIITLQDLPPELTKNLSLNYEDIVLEALRRRKFSHSSFTETAKELGTGRTLVNEHFRGVVMRILTQMQFDTAKTAALVALTDEPDVLDKVESKISTILENIKNDAAPLKGRAFTEVRNILQTKYKNLPKKYHQYQDEIIQRFL